jgi:transcriptional regulator with XRE-family HTH domain
MPFKGADRRNGPAVLELRDDGDDQTQTRRHDHRQADRHDPRTPHDVASRLRLATTIGVTKSVIFHFEHGHTRISVEMIERLAAALHCTVDHMLAPLDAPIPRSASVAP